MEGVGHPARVGQKEVEVEEQGKPRSQKSQASRQAQEEENPQEDG